MKKFFWLLLFFGAYIWMVSTENEEIVLEKGKALCRIITNWFSDAEVDFQMPNQKTNKHKNQRHRRWE